MYPRLKVEFFFLCMVNKHRLYKNENINNGYWLGQYYKTRIKNK